MSTSYFGAQTIEMIDGLRQDLLGILTVFWARDVVGSITMTGSDNREQMVAKLVSIDSSTRDLITRIVALDDTGKGKRSFPELLKLLEKESLTPSEIKHLHKQKKDFRAIINPLKTQHRNKNIGHIQTNANTYSKYLNETVHFVHLIENACVFLDTVTGEKIKYSLHVGSQEALINLRSFEDTNPHPLSSAGVVPVGS